MKPIRRKPPLLRADFATGVVALCAVVGVIQFYQPEGPLGKPPFRRLSDPAASYDFAAASANAFGRSGQVRLLFAMPGDRVEFPLAVGDDPAAIRYEWTSLRGTETAFYAQPLEGAELMVPPIPGFYYLTLVRGQERQIIREPTLAVLRPFTEKAGTMLNGYRIGTYLSERYRTRNREIPEGFLEVYPQFLDLEISKHLRLRHFVTQDDQTDVWPKYVALNPRLLDKLELIFVEIERWRIGGGQAAREIEIDVHSGFRTPAHNVSVRRAARDSRHQYGDAVDVVIDANGNGRIDAADHRLVATAVEKVERMHPDLAGGLGIYASRLYRTPYVHIDARGTRSRWRG